MREVELRLRIHRINTVTGAQRLMPREYEDRGTAEEVRQVLEETFEGNIYTLEEVELNPKENDDA